MASLGEFTALDYTATLAEWAGQFSHLPGFVYLDSGTNGRGAELEIVTALPTIIHRLQDYSANLTEWMTAVEADLHSGCARSTIVGTSGCFTGCVAIGSLDYDAPAGKLRAQDQPDSRTMAGLYHWLLVTHRSSQTTELLIHPDCPTVTRKRITALVETKQAAVAASFDLAEHFRPAISKHQYQAHIASIQNYILAGDCYQVNYAQRFEATLEGDAWSAYRYVRTLLAGGFSGFMRTDEDHAILSLSPERFLRIHRGTVTSQPIKGTAPRHSDPEQDAALAKALLDSEKDRAENVMITDLLRNDLGQFCETGSVRVTELCGLHSFNNVHHLISTVEGKLAPGVSAGQMLLATSPGGSITGAPKKRAVEIIAELEPAPRGAYCGSLFILGGDDWLQSSIAIRTLEVTGNTVHCWGGGGITASSHWEAEYQETLDKVGPIMVALEEASQCSGSSIPS
jgi:para-aminobenzoate synthetase component 1